MQDNEQACALKGCLLGVAAPFQGCSLVRVEYCGQAVTEVLKHSCCCWFAGPSAYSTAASLGSRALLSTQPNVPGAKMGTGQRFKQQADPQAVDFPGPGQYTGATAAVESRIPAMPSAGFARALRDANKKVAILSLLAFSFTC